MPKPRKKKKSEPPIPKLSELQRQLIREILLDYAVWYMTNREELEGKDAAPPSPPPAKTRKNRKK